MKLGTRETIEQLQRLIRLCSESRAELRWALRQMRDPHLQSVLQGLDADRARYLDELDETIHALGGTSAQWDGVDLESDRSRSSFEEDNADGALFDCVREEEKILSAYEHAVQEGGFDAATQRMLENQYAEIHAACDRLKTLSEQGAVARH